MMEFLGLTETGSEAEPQDTVSLTGFCIQTLSVPMSRQDTLRTRKYQIEFRTLGPTVYKADILCFRAIYLP
jgi:hypothetical protein